MKNVNPEMLILARESRELTQIKLAEMTSLTQAEVSRYEGGDRSVSDEHLRVLAQALEYPESFFTQSGRRYGLGSSGLHHRRRKALSQRTLNLFVAKTNIFRLVVDKLLKSVDIEHPKRFPQIEVGEYKGDIEYIAELVRSDWHLPPGPINDLVGAIENAGGIVHKLDFGTNKIDAFVQWIPPTPPVFLINKIVPGDRLRFTLAHEIGHLVMHDRPREAMEDEADKFAAAFLMPKKDILLNFTRVTLPHLAQLKLYWRVSISALIRRARDLGAISDRQYRTFNEEMGKMGYRIEEPNPIPVEEPSLFEDIIDAHLDGLGYTTFELARLVHLSEEDMRAEYLQEKDYLRLVFSPR